MMVFRRRKREALLAASLYEDLDAGERAALERLITREPSLAAERAGFERLLRAIPDAVPELSVDLRPRIRARLQEAAGPALSPRAASRRRYALAVVAAAVILGLVTTGWVEFGGHGASEGPVLEVPLTLMQAALNKAGTLVAGNEPAKAYDLLRDAVAAYPKDPLAGEAQLRVADLAFDLHRYPEAVAAYAKMIGSYGANLEQESGRRRHVVERRDLLAESEAVGFESLYALDTARNDRVDAFAKLEAVVGRYQNSLIAEEAAVEMGRMLMAATPPSDPPARRMLNAMQRAKERCSSPVAVALLDLKIGDLYRDELKDTAAAEAHYMRAAENSVVASRARNALDRLQGR
jgi:tetratricopeptide (TPR) repeat protein